MPNLQHAPTAELKAFIDWLFANESSGNPAVAALATHTRAHAGTAQSGADRWPNVEALKTSVRHYGPNVSLSDFDSAYSAFLAS
jgi:NAD(P)H-dependent FMN reductase